MAKNWLERTTFASRAQRHSTCSSNRFRWFASLSCMNSVRLAFVSLRTKCSDLLFVRVLLVSSIILPNKNQTTSGPKWSTSCRFVEERKAVTRIQPCSFVLVKSMMPVSLVAHVWEVQMWYQDINKPIWIGRCCYSRSCMFVRTFACVLWKLVRLLRTNLFFLTVVDTVWSFVSCQNDARWTNVHSRMMSVITVRRCVNFKRTAHGCF